MSRHRDKSVAGVRVSIATAPLGDALTRVILSREALLDGDHGLADELLDDLEHDLWQVLEARERAT
jgi:hypothetical protein